MIANIDENMSRLEGMLRETGLRENTILIFFTDNGTVAGARFYNRGLRGRKVQLYEGGHRVPCFVRWPAGGLRPRDVEGLTECQDLAPTLVDLCGLSVQDGIEFDGVSLAPVLRGEAERPPDRTLVVQYTPVRVNAGVVGSPEASAEPAAPRYGDAAVMWRQWRLIKNEKLYDLSRDPGQKENLIEKHPHIAARLRRHYDEWWKRVEPHGRPFQPVHIGSGAENPALLSGCEWAGVWMDQCLQVRRGERRNGTWHVQVEKPGDYEFTLRRWPEEAGAPLSGGVPPHEGEIGSYPAGVALPIARAKIRAGGRELRDGQPAGRLHAGAARALPGARLDALRPSAPGRPEQEQRQQQREGDHHPPLGGQAPQ